MLAEIIANINESYTTGEDKRVLLALAEQLVDEIKRQMEAEKAILAKRTNLATQVFADADTKGQNIPLGVPRPPRIISVAQEEEVPASPNLMAEEWLVEGLSPSILPDLLVTDPNHRSFLPPDKPSQTHLQADPAVGKDPLEKQQTPKLKTWVDAAPEINLQEKTAASVQMDLNQKFGQQPKPLNEVLSEKKPQLADVLAAPKVTDLRKAISVNEKFRFVGELFQGKEQLFEQSIRTINGFTIYAEAQFWMERELHQKLGWNRNDELVQHFYALVSRRFS